MRRRQGDPSNGSGQEAGGLTRSESGWSLGQPWEIARVRTRPHPNTVPHTAAAVLRQKVPEQGRLPGQLFDARGHTIGDQAH